MQKEEVTSQAKQQLKQEAKEMLLKGCYKMAMNKYLRLISMGPQHFSQRQWSIIHLNAAISLQFQQKLAQALEKTNQAIKIDPSYQKPYYRRLQILEEQGEYELALHDNIVPYFVSNREINELKEKIAEQYRQSLGLEQLTNKMKDPKFRQQIAGDPNDQQHKERFMKFVQHSHKAIFQKILAHVEQGQQLEQTIWDAIAQHYQYLKQQQSTDNEVSSFCKALLKLIVSLKSRFSKGELKFWELYCKEMSPKIPMCLLKSEFIPEQADTSEMRLLSYCPCSVTNPQIYIKILNNVISAKQEQMSLETVLKFIETNRKCISILGAENWKYLYDNVLNISDIYIEQTLERKADCLELSGYYEGRVVSDALLSFMNVLPGDWPQQVTDFRSAVYYQYRITSSNLASLRSEIRSEDILKNIIGLLKKKKNSHLLMASEMIENIPITQLSHNKQLVTMINNCMKQEISMKPDEQIIETILELTIMLKVDISQPILQSNPNIIRKVNGICNIAQTLPSLKTTSSYILRLYLKLLSYLCINNQHFLNTVLTHPKPINEIYAKIFEPSIHQLSSGKNPQGRVLDQIPIMVMVDSVRLLYLMIVDTMQIQQQQFAVQMGVDVEDIRKAKKLQGQKQDPVLAQELSQHRTDFIANFAANWLQILTAIVHNFNLLKNALAVNNLQRQASIKSVTSDLSILSLGSMLANVLHVLSTKNRAKFYHSAFITFMIDEFAYHSSLSLASDKSLAPIQHKTLQPIALFFTNISKSCNPNIYQYKHLQAIVDILVWSISNAKHELHIFEAGLALVSLSSMKIRMEIDVIISMLLEENQYIVHSGLELLNNMLVTYGEDGEGSGLSKQAYLLRVGNKIADIVGKYYKHYRQIVMSKKGKENVNFKDYSHPANIYCTILSVGMILQEMAPLLGPSSQQKVKIHELESWQEASNSLRLLSDCNISVTIFKLAIHHRDRLPNFWQRGLEPNIANLKEADEGKWLKLQAFIR